MNCSGHPRLQMIYENRAREVRAPLQQNQSTTRSTKILSGRRGRRRRSGRPGGDVDGVGPHILRPHQIGEMPRDREARRPLIEIDPDAGIELHPLEHARSVCGEGSRP